MKVEISNFVAIVAIEKHIGNTYLDLLLINGETNKRYAHYSR